LIDNVKYNIIPFLDVADGKQSDLINCKWVNKEWQQFFGDFYFIYTPEQIIKRFQKVMSFAFYPITPSEANRVYEMSNSIWSGNMLINSDAKNDLYWQRRQLWWICEYALIDRRAHHQINGLLRVILRWFIYVSSKEIEGLFNDYSEYAFPRHIDLNISVEQAIHFICWNFLKYNEIQRCDIEWMRNTFAVERRCNLRIQIHADPRFSEWVSVFPGLITIQLKNEEHKEIDDY
jgi:hypothetical protein